MSDMKMMNGRLLGAVALLGFAGLGGCQQTSQQTQHAIMLYRAGDFPAAANVIRPEIDKKNENFVLNNCRYGSAALAAGDLNGAENSFMAAYEVINGVNTNTGGRTLGATLVFEGVKVWKGEPFERAMAHYYLGMVYLLKHDYENARAAFQNSLFKLREYSDKDKPEDYRQSESNFALGYFGLGFCYMRMGKSQQASDNFAMAAKLDPYLAGVIQQVQQPGINTLMFIDAGYGPARAPKGWYNEESAFGPTPAEVGPIPPAVAFVNGKPINPTNVKFSTVDTLAMAQEQRWQDIDTIRKTKAVIGTGMMAAGTGMAAYGAHEGDEGLMWAGLGTSVLGGLLAASSQADLRYWEMLPRTVYIIPAALPPGQHTIAVQAGGSQSNPLTLTMPPVAVGPDGTPAAPKDTILYFRLR
jgi:tetratricopeptide (TPR) repeat protein